jgi:hypothetical protein
VIDLKPGDLLRVVSVSFGFPVLGWILALLGLSLIATIWLGILLINGMRYLSNGETGKGILHMLLPTIVLAALLVNSITEANARNVEEKNKNPVYDASVEEQIQVYNTNVPVQIQISNISNNYNCPTNIDCWWINWNNATDFKVITVNVINNWPNALSGIWMIYNGNSSDGERCAETNQNGYYGLEVQGNSTAKIYCPIHEDYVLDLQSVCISFTSYVSLGGDWQGLLDRKQVCTYK